MKGEFEMATVRDVTEGKETVQLWGLARGRRERHFEQSHCKDSLAPACYLQLELWDGWGTL